MPSREFRDPMILLEEKQQRELRRKMGACLDCKHQISLHLSTQKIYSCAIGAKPAQRFCKFRKGNE